MLVLKLEMWPGGREEDRYELARTYLARVNNAKAEETGGARADYIMVVARRGATEVPIEIVGRPIDERLRRGPRPTRTGWVKGFPRKSYSVWRLVLRGLKSCFPEEK
jgi:hypothetical protein